MAVEGSRKAIIAAMVANAGIAVAKFVAFLVTGASSMLAESIHSVADTSNQGLLLLGSRRARNDATHLHQFGYGRERYFWSFVVAVVLFSLGGLFALYEGIEKIRHPHELESIGWAIGVLVFGIVLETYSFRTAIVESNRVRGGRSWTAFIRHSRSPELPVVLLEDAGAMFGLVFALIAVVTAQVTGNPIWDGVGTAVIGVLLVLIAVVLAVEMKSLLIGESATSDDERTIRDHLAAHPDVQRILHLRTQHVGPDELLVTAKLQFDAGHTFEQVAAAIDEIESTLREVLPRARMIYLEPALPGGDHEGTPMAAHLDPPHPGTGQ